MSGFFLVLIVTAYDCPWGLGKAPAAVKELVCRVERREEVSEIFPSKAEALKKMTPAHSLYQVVVERGKMSRRRVNVKWKPE